MDRNSIHRPSLEHGLYLLIVDYLHLMSGSNRHCKNCIQEISPISRGLGAFANKINVPVIRHRIAAE
ncbi:MAG: DnaB-like helicase C-terminal domain-containing protein [Acidobacteriota bacterium]|jgi:replicative DNA helicase